MNEFIFIIKKVNFNFRRVRAVEVPCVLNIAAVKLKSKEYDEVIKECNKVLDMEVRKKISIFQGYQTNIKADCHCL